MKKTKSRRIKGHFRFEKQEQLLLLSPKFNLFPQNKHLRIHTILTNPIALSPSSITKKPFLFLILRLQSPTQQR